MSVGLGISQIIVLLQNFLIVIISMMDVLCTMQVS
jgi:hypothetical protein